MTATDVVQWGAAVALAASTTVWLCWHGATYWAPKVKAAADQPVDMESTLEQYAATVAANADGDSASAMFDRVKDLYDKVDDNAKSSEAKASTILGFLGGGISLYALLAAGKVTTAQQPSPLVVVGFVALLASLLCALLCLAAARRRGIPELTEIRRQLAKSDIKKAALFGFLTLVWQRRLRGMSAINARKAHRLELTQQLFGVGTLCIALSYGIAAFQETEPRKRTQIECGVERGSTLLRSQALHCSISGETSESR